MFLFKKLKFQKLLLLLFVSWFCFWIKESILMNRAVEKHMQTFHHREKKKVCLLTVDSLFACEKLVKQFVTFSLLFHECQLPSFLDWFGWCTWDAFYTEVTAEGVDQGLKRSISLFLFVCLFSFSCF